LQKKSVKVAKSSLKIRRNLREISDKYIAGTYARQPVVLVRGKGSWVWDSDGNKYLDFVGGIAVCVLGHSHPAVAKAISAQAKKLLHVSNLYYIEQQINLAELLVKNSFAGRIFFCNSGAEANEAAIKLARRYSIEKHGEERFGIIAMKNSFHGRTIAALSATGQEKFRKGFGPMLEGFYFAEFNDINSLTARIDNSTCAVLLEPIQCEGGIYAATQEYLKSVRKICDDRNLLLIFDEVQTGIGRTGKLFCYEHYGVKPDIMTLAKGLGNGVPIGAMIAREDIASVFNPGSHASTFGGNPLAASAGMAVLNTLLETDVLKNCKRMGDYLGKRLSWLKSKFDFIKDSRGMGLIQGIELNFPGKAIVDEARKKGLLINCTSENVLRFSPPLIVKEYEIDAAIEILSEIFQKVSVNYN